MLGFKNFRCACILLSGIELMHMIAKGQMGTVASDTLVPSSSTHWRHKQSSLYCRLFAILPLTRQNPLIWRASIFEPTQVAILPSSPHSTLLRHRGHDFAHWNLEIVTMTKMKTAAANRVEHTLQSICFFWRTGNGNPTWGTLAQLGRKPVIRC
jgi:hypothetical protein